MEGDQEQGGDYCCYCEVDGPAGQTGGGCETGDLLERLFPEVPADIDDREVEGAEGDHRPNEDSPASALVP